MNKLSEISKDFKKYFELEYSPIGFHYSETKPEDAIGLKKKGRGCIIPLILASGKGKTVVFDKNSTGWDCSAFHLGYKDWIFPGIEYFLSHKMLFGSNCERFVKTPKLAKNYVKSIRFKKKSEGYSIFKALEKFTESEKPELVIFLANPDQLSGLVYLLQFDNPESDDRIVTKFASACGSIITLPLQYARKGEKKAFWGLHDISARTRFSKELMSITMPYELLEDIYKNINDSFLITERWQKIAKRNIIKK